MKNQSGNVLFLILIAVALFAALSYAVTSSSRSGTPSISKEVAKSNAAAFLQYATALRQAITKIKMNNGCDDTMLEFRTRGYTTYNGTPVFAANTNAPASKACHLYEAVGGGMAPVMPTPTSLDMSNYTISPTTTIAGTPSFLVTQLPETGTSGAAGLASANDLVMSVGTLNKETCMAFNNLLDVPNDTNQAPVINATGTYGAYTNGSYTSNSIFANDSRINGKAGFCRFVTPNYQLFFTLIAR